MTTPVRFCSGSHLIDHDADLRERGFAPFVLGQMRWATNADQDLQELPGTEVTDDG